MLKLKLYSIALILVFVSALIYGVFTKMSFYDDRQVGNLNDYAHFSIALFEDNPEEFNENIKTIKDLENISDVIVKVKNVNKRESKSRAILSTVAVKEVIEGELLSNEILIYEPAYFFRFKNEIMNGRFSTDGYQLLNGDEEYIMFLKKMEFPAGYKPTLEEEQTYVPISMLYGKFPAERFPNPFLYEGDEIIYEFKDIIHCDILSSDKDKIDLYINLTGEVQASY